MFKSKIRQQGDMENTLAYCMIFTIRVKKSLLPSLKQGQNKLDRLELNPSCAN